MRRFWYLLCLLALLTIAAAAQTIGGFATLNINASSSSSVALPASLTQYPAVMVWPGAGNTSEIFYAFGNSSVTASTSTSPALLPGGECFLLGGSVTYIAAIAGGSPGGAVRIKQYTACPAGMGFAKNTNITPPPTCSDELDFSVACNSQYLAVGGAF